MKVINHQKNNFYDLDTYIMRGTIEMTPKEWTKAYLWLWGQYQKAIKDIATYERDSLSSLKREQGKIFSIGVCATKLLFKRFKLKNYKDQNYAIKIV